MEQLLNFVYFFIGLAVGVAGLWQNQKYYIAQQQDKFDKIDEKLQALTKTLATIQESISEKSHEREARVYSTLDTTFRAILNAKMLNRDPSPISPEIRDSSEIQRDLIQQIDKGEL